MSYDTATQIIAAAASECGLTAVADPYSSTDDAQIQLRNLLNQCGRELYSMSQWQQLVKSATISTGVDPEITHPEGRYTLEDDFGYFINSTGWTPSGSGGMGLPLGGPLTEQQYTYLVATNMGNSTVYVQFLMTQRTLQFLPTPAPANIDITYRYMSNGWVAVHGSFASVASFTANADDVVIFEPILISTMLAMRFRQAKGIDAAVLTQRFQLLYSQFSGVNAPAPILRLAHYNTYPLLDPWRNVPDSGFGS